MADWSVVVAQPQKTQQVSDSLTANAIEHFIPQEEITSIRNGRHQRRHRPMLGRYVLYAVNELWRSVATMRGVSGLMLAIDYEKDAEQPALVNPVQLAELVGACVDGVYQSKVIAPNGFTYGQRVTPKTGPFAYHVGRFDSQTKRGDSAMFALFGREQRVMFKPGELVAA